MVAEAVFAGLISEDYLTQEEVDEMFMIVAEAAFEEELLRAQERGCNVFAGFEEELVH